MVEGFHDHLIHLRGKHIAHSVNPFEDVAIGVVVVPGPGDEAPTIAVGHLLMKLVGLPLQALQHFETLATFLLAEAGNLYGMQLEVVRSEAGSFDLEVVLALPEMKLVVPGPDEVTVSKLDEPKGSEANPYKDRKLRSQALGYSDTQGFQHVTLTLWLVLERADPPGGDRKRSSSPG